MNLSMHKVVVVALLTFSTLFFLTMMTFFFIGAFTGNEQFINAGGVALIGTFTTGIAGGIAATLE